MKMKAVVKSGYGGPEVLQFVEVDRPELVGPHDVLVRVHAAGVNFSDVHTRRAAFDGYEALRARVDKIRRACRSKMRRARSRVLIGRAWSKRSVRT